MEKDQPKERAVQISKFDRLFPKFIKKEVEHPPITDALLEFFAGGIAVGNDPPGR